MPDRDNRPECADAYRLALGAGRLYIPPENSLVSWYSGQSSGVTARLHIEGTPEDERTGQPVIAYVALSLNALNPLLSIALIWDRARVYSIDMGGDKPHLNAGGRPIKPPHRHFYRPSGAFDTEPVDLGASEIAAPNDHQGVMRHFFEWCGLDGRAVQWQDPPLIQETLGLGVPPYYLGSE